MNTQNDYINKATEQILTALFGDLAVSIMAIDENETKTKVEQILATALADARKEGYEEGYQDGFDRKPRPISDSAYKHQQDVLATLREEEP